MKRRLAIGLVLILVTFIGCQMKTPPPTGLRSGSLLPCPDSPNCVCSQDSRPEHQVDPIAFSGDVSEAMQVLKKVILAEPRTRVVDERPGYLHVEYTSLVFRFKDDLEVLANEGARQFHVRSASRVGHSDLGVNRKRVERLRVQFAAATHPPSPPQSATVPGR